MEFWMKPSIQYVGCHSNMHLPLFRTFLLLLLAINSTNSLRCYTCSYVATSNANKACVDNPEESDGQKFTVCNKKFCTIQRQELTVPKGVINSFLRGCEDKPLNQVFEDPTFKTYFRSCNTDLCNNGDGLKSSSLGASPDGEPGSNLLVAGISSRAATGRSTCHATTTHCAHVFCVAFLVIQTILHA